MQITTFFKKTSVFLVLILAAAPVWSYGDCEPPRFKNLKPAKNIEPGGELSFTASSNTLPHSIEVIIKGYKVDLKVRDYYGYQVTGNMPAELTEGFALANIKANSYPNSCITEKKWLFKIATESPVEEQQSPVQEEQSSEEEKQSPVQEEQSSEEEKQSSVEE